MVEGARLVSLTVAATDVRAALEGLSTTDQVGVLMGVLAGLGRRTGDAKLFLALVQQAVADRLATGADRNG